MWNTTLLLSSVAADDSGGNRLLDIIMMVVPWVLIFLIAWFFVFKNLRDTKKVSEQVDRYKLHMDRTEAQQEKVVQLLEQINAKLDKRSPEMP